VPYHHFTTADLSRNIPGTTLTYHRAYLAIAVFWSGLWVNEDGPDPAIAVLKWFGIHVPRGLIHAFGGGLFSGIDSTVLEFLWGCAVGLSAAAGERLYAAGAACVLVGGGISVNVG
jgi:hypothetical protein